MERLQTRQRRGRTSSNYLTHFALCPYSLKGLGAKNGLPQSDYDQKNGFHPPTT